MNTFGQLRVPYHVGNLQIFNRDPIESLNKIQRDFVVKVPAGTLNLQVTESETLSGFHPIPGTPSLRRQDTLRATKRPFRSSKIAGIQDLFSIRERGKGLDPDIHADPFTGFSLWLRHRNIRDQESIPTIRAMNDAKMLYPALNGTRQPHTYLPYTWNSQHISLERACLPLVDLLRERSRSRCRLEARKARCLPMTHAPEECLERTIQLLESILLNAPLTISDPWQRAGFCQFARLFKIADRLALLIPQNPLFQCAVVDKAGILQRLRGGLFEGAILANLVFEGFGYNRINHAVRAVFANGLVRPLEKLMAFPGAVFIVSPWSGIRKKRSGGMVEEPPLPMRWRRHLAKKTYYLNEGV